MFSLEQAIADWRLQMVKAGIKTPAPLEELESHLREVIEQQQRAGLNDHQALDLAVQRVGQAGALQKEFSKISVCGPRLPLKYLRLYCYIAAPFLLLVSLGMRALNEITSVELAWRVLLALYIGALPRWHRLLANPRNRLVRSFFLIGCLWAFTWPVWIMLHLPDGIFSILPAWFAVYLACYGQPDAAEQTGSTAASNQEKYV